MEDKNNAGPLDKFEVLVPVEVPDDAEEMEQEGEEATADASPDLVDEPVSQGGGKKEERKRTINDVLLGCTEEAPPAKRTLHVLSLKERMAVIKDLDEGKTAAQTAKKFNVSVSQVYRTKRRRTALEDEFSRANPKRQGLTRSRKITMEAVDRAFSAWFDQMSRKGGGPPERLHLAR